MRIFIDSEFTDFFDIHLISLGMTAETGEDFYAEVPYPDRACSAFVREAVIPLLGKFPEAVCTKDELRPRIWTWLEIVRRSPDEDIYLCADSQHDLDLFADAMDYRIPSWCKLQLIPNRNINELLRYSFHRTNNLPEHHALFDAQANRYAYRPDRDGALFESDVP